MTAGSIAKDLGMPVNSPGAVGDVPEGTSLHALDRLNAFLAALLTGAGPFVAVSLTDRGWTPANIGIVLTASSLAGLLSQVPAGELIDKIRSKRIIVAVAAAAVTLAILVYGLRRDFPSVFAAAILLGAAGSILGPAVVAISLGLVGQDGLGQRLGRNQRFASIGGLVAAAIMGIVGYALSARDILFVTAAFGLPALLALAHISSDDIHFARSCSSSDHHATPPPRVSRAILFKDRRLVTFAACLFLFQFANASILPLVGETLVHADGRWSSIVMSVLIVVPQVIVALFAPWVGRTAGTWGRRPLLIIGLGMVPIRATLFALTADPGLLFVFQILDGITGATLGVLTALVVADLAKGTGRFNLAQGLIGMVSGIGASLSTSISGLIVGKFGQTAGFLSIAGVGLVAVTIVWMFMPETKPAIVQQKTGTS
jgi:MFS family permease